MRIIDPSQLQKQVIFKNIHQDRLTRFIDVHVQILKKEGDATDYATFTVGIHDKISKILNLLGMDNVGGQLIRNDKVLRGEADLDQTFAKSFIQNGAKFAMMSGEVSKNWPEP